MINVNLLDPLNEALKLARTSFDEFLSLGADGMTVFIRDIPTRHVDLELQLLRHVNPESCPKTEDLDNLAASSVAVIYYDIA